MESKCSLKNPLLEKYSSLHLTSNLTAPKVQSIPAKSLPQKSLGLKTSISVESNPSYGLKSSISNDDNSPRTYGFKSITTPTFDTKIERKSPSLFNPNLLSSTSSQKPVNANVLEVSRRKGLLVESQHTLTGSLHSKNLPQSTNLTSMVEKSKSKSSKAFDNKTQPEKKESPRRKEKKESLEQKRKIVQNKKSSLDESQSSSLPVYNIALPKVLEREIKPDFLFDAFSHRNEQFEQADLKLLKKKQKEIDDGKKIYMINLVSIVLMQQPDFFREDDKVRQELMLRVNEMASIDPEFILKLTLYSRKTLNLRLVSNFLLAYSAFRHETRPYLKKYFAKCIGLPSDWVKVAELYQTFFDKSITAGALPSALRNSMIEKFKEFDEYQLGKYNKEKPAKITFHESRKADGEESVSILEPYTLKKLIRKLHINEPAYNVMCIIGKKYPLSSEKFYQSRLSGIFDETKAGQRMKLAIPETWETQVSLKGNKAETWQELIDHKKLPFMAMLRNLRNMLIAGIEQKYHNLNIKRLTDKKQVVNSKQLPFRFLSSYEVIDELEEILEASNGTNYSNVGQLSKKRGSKPIKIQSNAFSKALLQRYKTALNTALKLSTIYNIPPICGKTILLIYYDSRYDEECCASARSVSKQRTVIEMCILLGLMCKFHCEDSQLILIDTQQDYYIEVDELNPDSILENVNVLKEKLREVQKGKKGFQKFLNEFMMERKRVDIMMNLGGAAHNYTSNFMKAYRKDVNPNCLNITMALKENKTNTELRSKLDVHVCGFSESILMYIAEVGNRNQLNKVENIDFAYGLHEINVKNKKKDNVLQVSQRVERPLSPWQNIRVFISSTFKDMHGERDLLTRFVFPELRARCFKYCLNLYEVDLRWGITQKQSEEEAMELCLREVNKADLFIGILGERYGWIPDTTNLSNTTEFQWLKSIAEGTSMTELEMRCFKKNVDKDFNDKAMFFIRDKEFMNDVPKKYIRDFECEDSGTDFKLQHLKHWLEEIDANVSWNYPCTWGGVLGNKPMVSGLEKFGKDVLSKLWSCIENSYLVHTTEDKESLSMKKANEDLHFDFAQKLSNTFVGRKRLIEKTVKVLSEEAKEKAGKNLLMVTGKSGAGKTAFMAKLSTAYSDMIKSNSCSYSYDAAEDQQTLPQLLYHIFDHMNLAVGGEFSIPEKYSELKKRLEELFEAVSKNLVDDEQYVIFIDSLDKVLADSQSLTEWIPRCIPKGIILVISCSDLSTCQRNLSAHKQLFDVVKVGDLDHADRASFVRQFMLDYGKKLSESAFDNQMKYLLSKKDSSLPLYLVLACDELRMYGIFEGITDHIKTLPPNMTQMIEFSLSRMESESGASLMSDALSLLFFSRQGLDEEELFDAMNMMESFKDIKRDALSNVAYNSFYKAEYLQQKLPYLHFIKLCRSIDALVYTNKQTGIKRLINKDIRQLVDKRYIVPGGKLHMSKSHIVLAGLYKKQADPTNDFKYLGSYRKAFIELPYHLTASGVAWDNLRELLCSLNYIQAKVDQKMSHQLLEDYQIDASAFSKDIELERKKILNHTDVIETKDFLSRNIHIISKYPSLLIQQAINSPDGSYVKKCAKSMSNVELQNVIIRLNEQNEEETCTLTISHKEPVTSICVSNDELLIACGLVNGQVIVYDKETTKEVQSFIGHSASITSCCFLGLTKLCSSSDDSTISVWDLNDGKRLHILDKHTRVVSCCKSTKDGRLLLSTSLDNTAKLWNAHDGSIAADLPFTSYHPFNCVAFDPQEKNAALGSWNQIIVEWNILENKKAGVYKGHSSSIRAVAYAPSGLYLASASMNGEVIMWSTNVRSMVGLLTSHSSPLNTLSFTSNGLQLIGGAIDNKLKIWAGTLGTPGDNILPEGNGSSKADYALCVSVNTDYIAVGYNSGAVIVYSGKKAVFSKAKAHSSSVRAISFMKCRSWKSEKKNVHLVTASDDCSLKRWSLSKDMNLVYTMQGHSQPIKCMAAKEAFIVSGSEDFTLHVWKGLHFENDANGTKDPAYVLRGHSAPVSCCDISSCETMAISGSGDKTIVIWDLNKGNKLCTVPQAHTDGLTACSWSNLGNYFVTGSNDFLLKLWDAKFLVSNTKNVSALKEKTKFAGHVATINDVKYKYGCIVSAAADGCIKVWTHKGVEITTFFMHKQRINGSDIFANVNDNSDGDMNWSDDPGQKGGIQQNVIATKLAVMDNLTVYTASDDGYVSSFMPFRPNLINEVFGHSDMITDVSVASKKTEVTSSSNDGALKVWDSTIFTQQVTSKKHSGEVSCLAAYDGINLIASGGFDGRVHIYKETNHQMTFTVSKNAVEGLGFLSGEHLVTADALGNVAVYDLNLEKVICSMALNDFVQTLAVSKDGLIAVSCFTQFKILQFKSEWIDKSLVLKLQSKESKEPDATLDIYQKSENTLMYPMSLMVFMDDTNVLLSAENYEFYRLVDYEKLQESSKVKFVSKHKFESLGKKKESEVKSAATCLAYAKSGSKTVVLIGNENGTVSFEEDDSKSQKVHDGAVTGILFDKDKKVLVTASKDCMIKIWRFAENDVLQQVGLYHCHVPVTKLIGFISSTCSIIYGDKSGNVNFLKVNL